MGTTVAAVVERFWGVVSLRLFYVRRWVASESRVFFVVGMAAASG